VTRSRARSSCLLCSPFAVRVQPATRRSLCWEHIITHHFSNKTVSRISTFHVIHMYIHSIPHPVCFVLFCFVRQGLTMKARLTWYFQSSCLSLSSAGIIGMKHHTQLLHPPLCCHITGVNDWTLFGCLCLQFQIPAAHRPCPKDAGCHLMVTGQECFMFCFQNYPLSLSELVDHYLLSPRWKS
jgi:hypothetical protein